MPITPPIPIAYSKSGLGNDFVVVAGPFPVPETERIEVSGVRFTDYLQETADGVIVTFGIQSSKNGGWDFDASVKDLTGGVWESGDSFDTPEPFKYPWVAWDLDTADLPYDEADYRDATNIWLVAELDSSQFTETTLQFARMQVSYTVKSREVVRAPSPRAVIAGTDAPQRYRTTTPVKPFRNTAHLRCIFEVQGLVSEGTSPVITPIWWYRNEPTDLQDWTYGGAVGTGVSANGKHITYTTSEASPLNAMQSHQQIAFGFQIENGGSSGDLTFAVVKGTFEYF